MAHPVCRPVWIARRAAVLCCAPVAACSAQPEPSPTPVAVVRTRAATPTRPVAAPVAAATPRAERSPTPPRRAFVDPPLPAELVDPPGLVPLPPRPVFTTDTTQGGPRP